MCVCVRAWCACVCACVRARARVCLCVWLMRLYVFISACDTDAILGSTSMLACVRARAYMSRSRNVYICTCARKRAWILPLSCQYSFCKPQWQTSHNPTCTSTVRLVVELSGYTWVNCCQLMVQNAIMHNTKLTSNVHSRAPTTLPLPLISPIIS